MSESAKPQRRSAISVARLLLPTLLALAMLAALSSSASAAITRFDTGVSFGPDGVGGTEEFGEISDIAVEASSGDLYVLDVGSHRLYKFTAAGVPIKFGGLPGNFIEEVGGIGGSFNGNQVAIAPAGALGGTAGDIYVAAVAAGTGIEENGSLKIYSSAGAKIGEIEGRIDPEVSENPLPIFGVATDAAGNFYLSESRGKVTKYTPAQNPPVSGDATESGIIVESTANLVVGAGSKLFGVSNAYGLFLIEGLADNSPAEIDPEARKAAIDPASGDLLAERESEVLEYSQTGNLLGSFGAEIPRGSIGIAVGPDGMRTYLSSPGKVAIFGGATLVPNAKTQRATARSNSAATLNGEVGAAGGPAATCEFEYVTNEAFESERFATAQKAPCAPAGPFSGAQENAVTAQVAGLTPATTYRFRIIATNSNGSFRGQALSFTTAAVQMEPTTAITGNSATLNGTVAPEGLEVEECVFEFGVDGSFDQTAPCAESGGEIGQGSAAVPVHVAINDLNAGSNYSARLTVETESGTVSSTPIEFGTPGPTTGELEAIPGETTAVLRGQVNPRGEETKFAFQYVSKAAFDQSGFTTAQETPAGGEGIGAGTTELPVEALATNLAPGTAYVVRLLATNAQGTRTSAVVHFQTYVQSLSGLADGRAYEQVTPVSAQEKNGTDLLGNELNVLNASPSGDMTTYYSVTGAADTENGIQYPVYVASRSAESWASTAVNIPSRAGNTIRTMGWTETLSGAYVTARGGESPAALYLKEFPSGKLITITDELENTTLGPRVISTSPLNTAIAAESSGGGVVLFESEATLAPGAADIRHKENVYAWTKATGEIRLVSVLPDGTTAPGAAAGAWGFLHGSLHLEGTEEFEFEGANGKYYTQNTINQDGTKAFFSTTTGTRQIFMRTDPAGPSGVTTEISTSQKTNGSGPNGTDPRGPFPADYLGATPSGSYVFFKSHEELTNDAHTGGFPSEEFDLYRYDTATGKLDDLTPTGAGSENAQVLGLAGFSDDGAYAYIVAAGALLPGAAPEGRNLYVWHEGEPIQLISQLSGGSPDEEIWLPTREAGGSIQSAKTASVTADGQTLMFASAHQFEGFPNPSGRSEIYRWEFGGSGLQCVSCNPTGGSTSQNSFLRHGEGYFVQPDVFKPVIPRNLSANGKRVFFATAENLVGRDTNGVEDVYEWEADGEGSCHSTSENGGCIYLISTGTSPERSYFSGASANGDDVFFFTPQQLVGQDQDEYFDAYDARVGGGIAAQNPTPVTPCEGEACLGGSVAPTPSQSPGTSTFSGPGNEKPKPTKHKKKHKKKHKRHGNKTNKGTKKTSKSGKHSNNRRRAGGNR